MMLVPMTHPTHWEWVKKKTHVIGCEDSQGIVALDDTGQIVAALVADSFTVDSCCVHMAIANPMVLRHRWLEEIATHLYRVCGRQRLFGLVPDNNNKAISLNKHIGFTEVARIPNAVATGVGYVVMVMERAGCRWLDEGEAA